MSGDIIGTVLENARPEIWRTILEQLPTVVYLLDGEQKILFWNAGAERITGRLSRDVVGRLTRGQLIAGADVGDNPESPTDPAGESPHGESGGSECHAYLNHSDGHRIPISLRSFPVRDPEGQVVCAAESFEVRVAAPEWDRRKSKLNAYGCLDSATGVLTRDFAESHLRESLVTFYSHPVPFAIFCVQADDMDNVRHKYGPRAAQDILRVVGQTLDHSLRPNDIVGHWDDDEFLVLLVECSRAEIEKVGERLQKMLADCEIRWWGDALRISVSFGGTTVFSGDTLELLLQRAHHAMLTSASAGGNRLTILEV